VRVSFRRREIAYDLFRKQKKLLCSNLVTFLSLFLEAREVKIGQKKGLRILERCRKSGNIQMGSKKIRILANKADQNVRELSRVIQKEPEILSERDWVDTFLLRISRRCWMLSVVAWNSLFLICLKTAVT